MHPFLESWIYITNNFIQGIQASRFNHSCVYNAEEIWNEKDGAREIRTVTDIKIDNEMTINYAYPTISLKIELDKVFYQHGIFIVIVSYVAMIKYMVMKSMKNLQDSKKKSKIYLEMKLLNYAK